MLRTADAGRLRATDAGTHVELAGWVAHRRDHGGVAFVDLRDGSGIVQVVVRDAEVGHELRNEYCVRIAGAVAARPTGNENPEIPTGDIEVIAAEVEILSRSEPLPFTVSDEGAPEVGEEARLRWRYLDLRRPGAAEALKTRSKVTRVLREVMAERDFFDVETPYLTRSTPEGARDFLVPVRLQPGTWYALPQSPQLFKQLLMVAGLERYFQIARCFRDEDLRADRQPEFTQLDIEMSFVDESDLIELTEELFTRVWREVLGVELTGPFPRMTYAEAMRRFGSDRPDTRFGLELVDVTQMFADTTFRVFQADHVGAVVMPGGGGQTRRELDAWQDWAKGRGARGLAYVLVGDDGGARDTGPVVKNLGPHEREALPAAVGASPGDAIFFAAGERTASLELLGALRLELARRLDLIPAGRWDLLWVTDFPMFEPTDTGWTAVHHPFTAPKAEFEPSFSERPADALARAYDIVVNGVEIGGGSIRIHSGDVQQRVFDTIGLSKPEAESQFGFLLEAFRYGPPPHGGIAFGVDRLCAMLAGSESIREVIAFPKTASGGDPLTGAPTAITTAQRKEAGVDAPAPEPAG